WLDGDRRVLHEVENCIALRTIVEYSATAANNHMLSAEDVVCKAKSRREVDAAIPVQAWLHSLPPLYDTIRQLSRVWHRSSNVGPVNRVRRCCNKAWSEQPRIYAAAVGSAARVGSDASRFVQERSIRRIKTVREEVGCLQVLVVLGLNPIESHSVVEGQP